MDAASFGQVLAFDQNPAEGDRQLHVRFYVDEVPDPVATADHGRPMFKSVEFCEIRVPGSHDVHVEKVEKSRPDIRKRFPVQYARFKQGMEEQHNGTLLREWGLISRASALSYQALGIWTVEQLAAVSDMNLPKGASSDRQKAIDFLAVAKGQAPLSQARAEMAKQEERLKSLESQNAELIELVKALRSDLDAATAPPADSKVRRLKG